MKHFLILLLTILSISCTNHYNFEFGSSLAHFQDAKFQDYKEGKELSKEEKVRFKNNLWIKMSNKLAPSNLVIRHYCLIDLYNKRPRNKRKIQNLLNLLGNGLYKEGYSYWLYVKPFLVEYNRRYNLFDCFIKDMDLNFQKTAYLGTDGKLYPVPFGDLRHIPLELGLQSSSSVSENLEIYPVIVKIKSNYIEYFIQRCPLGFNTHIPDKTQVVRVNNDGSEICVFNYIDSSEKCKPFEWYEGYDKKYKDKEEEFKDTFNKNRRLSLFNYKEWWKKYIEIFNK